MSRPSADSASTLSNESERVSSSGSPALDSDKVAISLQNEEHQLQSPSRRGVADGSNGVTDGGITVERMSAEVSSLRPNLSDATVKASRKAANSHAAVLAASVSYHGTNIGRAAQQGSLPMCVLLWGIAASKRISLMVADAHGNNPMHYAAMADTPEVMGFFHQQTRGYFDSETRLVDSRNDAGETPLLRAMMIGHIPVVKVRGFYIHAVLYFLRFNCFLHYRHCWRRDRMCSSETDMEILFLWS